MKLDSEKKSNMFVCAFRGIVTALKSEKNLKIDLCRAILVIIFGIYFKINWMEWIACFFSIGMILFAELINTAIEATVDMVTQEYNEYAKIAKDCGSAATGLMSVLATVVNLIIFVPYVMKFIINLF